MDRVQAMATSSPVPNALRVHKTRTLSEKVPLLRDEPLASFIEGTDWTEAGLTLEGVPKGMRIHPLRRSEGDSELLIASVHAMRLVDAVLATVYVDLLAGVRFKFCELPEYMNIFELTSGQLRMYCTNAHAHKAAMHRKRQEKRAARKSAVETLPGTQLSEGELQA